MSFYQTAAGAELDAVVTLGRRTIGVEFKLSSTPKPGRGFWSALDDIRADRAFVVAPVEARYPIGNGVEMLPLQELDTLFG